MKKLALFDMDGTLFDTAEVNYLSYKSAAETLGYKIERDIFMKNFVGKNYRDFLPLFGITSAEDLAIVHDEKKKLYPRFLDHTKANIFLVDIIENLPQNYVKALVTTASKQNVMDLLRVFEMQDVFDFMITQDDAARLKPDPQAYIMAMERAQIAPENTIIFEDSDVGIQAAKAAGTAILQVRRF